MYQSDGASIGIQLYASDGNSYFNTGNNFGIGLTTPAAPLHVVGDISSSGGDIQMDNTYGIKTKTASGTSYRFIEAKNDNRIYLRANSTTGNHLVIEQGAGGIGYIGINTSDPNTALHMYGTASFMGGAIGIGLTDPDAALHIETGSAASAPTLIALHNTASGVGVGAAIVFRAGAGYGEQARIVGGYSVDGLSTNALHFYTGNTPVHRMVINGSGYVGIGTNNPLATLDVSGSTNFGYNSSNVHNITGSVRLWQDGTTSTKLIFGNPSSVYGKIYYDAISAAGFRGLYIQAPDVSARGVMIDFLSTSNFFGIRNTTDNRVFSVDNNGLMIASASSIFGNILATDTHQFTGSILATGSVNLSGQMGIGTPPSGVYQLHAYDDTGADVFMYFDSKAGNARYVLSADTSLKLPTLVFYDRTVTSTWSVNNAFWIGLDRYPSSVYASRNDAIYINNFADKGHYFLTKDGSTVDTRFTISGSGEIIASGSSRFGSNPALHLHRFTGSIQQTGSGESTSFIDNFQISGALNVSGAATITGYSASTTVFKVEGTSGSLFEVTDELSGSLFSVNDISGLTILEVFSDDKVVAGRFNTNTFVVTGSRVGIGLSTPSVLFDVSGSTKFGNTVPNDSHQFTGSLTISGTVGINTTAVGTGYNLNILGSAKASVGMSFGSYAISSTAGFYLSNWSRGQYKHSIGDGGATELLLNTGDGATYTSGSIIFLTDNVEKARITGSSVGIGTNKPMAMLDVSGSTHFGNNQSSDIHQFTGSIGISGSIEINGSQGVTATIEATGSLIVVNGIIVGYSA
jgi:hypothetical protein